MKLKNTLGLVIAGIIAATSLTGCEDTTTYTPQQVDSATRTQINADDVDLKKALSDAQAKDPSIKDMYYSVDSNGNKQVNVVREVKDPTTGEAKASSDIYPLLGGMAAGYLVSQMFNSSGGYNSAYRPSYSNSYSYSEERRRKNSAVAGYAGYVRSNTVKSFSSKSYTPSKSSVVSSSRLSGVFSSSSSARSSGYSAGG